MWPNEEVGEEVKEKVEAACACVREEHSMNILASLNFILFFFMAVI